MGFNEGYLIPRSIGKKTSKDMYDALDSLYQSVNVSRNILLRNKLTTTHMRKIDTIGSYLMKIVELSHEDSRFLTYSTKCEFSI